MNFTIELTASPTLLEAIRIFAAAITGRPAVISNPVIAPAMPQKVEVVTPRVEVITQEATQDETDTPQDAPSFTLEQVRAAAQAKSQAGKREEVRALITALGADNLPSLDPSRFAEFMSKLETL